MPPNSEPAERPSSGFAVQMTSISTDNVNELPAVALDGSSDDRLEPSSPAPHSQHKAASMLCKMSPELLGIIMSCSAVPEPGLPETPTRSPKHTAELKSWACVSRCLSFAAARYLWRTVVLTSDRDVIFVQSAINASGGRHGRVGSSIRTLYTKFRWTSNSQAIVVLASGCSTLRRLDAPVWYLVPIGQPITNASSTFHRLRALTLFGNRTISTHAFGAYELAGLAALEHLTINAQLKMLPNGPTPTFSLVSLAWQGKYQPEAVRWTLQKSTALQVLMLRHTTVTFLEQCLVQHGKTLFSLRLLLQGSVPVNEFPQLLDVIGTKCPNLLELLWDLCPDPSLLDRLPPVLEHITLKPGRKSKIFTGGAFLDWIDARKNIRVLTLWGNHAMNLLYRVEHPYKTKHEGFNAQVHITREWKESDLLRFAPMVCGGREWPFEDSAAADYVSPVIPNHR